MAAQQVILTIVAIRESIRLIGDLVNALQLTAGVTDEEMAKAKADAEAAHNKLQKTP